MQYEKVISTGGSTLELTIFIDTLYENLKYRVKLCKMMEQIKIP